MVAVDEPHAAVAGVGNMATQWLEERAATRALVEEMAMESGADVDEWRSRLRELYAAGADVEELTAAVTGWMEGEAGSGFSRWTMTSSTWLDATISKSAGGGRTAMTRCRMFYGYYTARELFAYVPASHCADTAFENSYDSLASATTPRLGKTFSLAGSRCCGFLKRAFPSL